MTTDERTVIIVRCSVAWAWYRDFIGITVAVIHDPKTPDYWRTVNPPIRGILKQDCTTGGHYE